MQTEIRLRAEEQARREAEEKSERETQARTIAEEQAKRQGELRIKAETRAEETEHQVQIEAQARIKAEQQVRAELEQKASAYGQATFEMLSILRYIAVLLVTSAVERYCSTVKGSSMWSRTKSVRFPTDLSETV